jgi:opacity protein-like surface antigen
MRPTAFRVLLLAAMIAAGNVAASAQDADTPKADLFVGYSPVFFAVDTHADATHGFTVSGTGNVNHWFGLTGEVSGHYTGGDAAHFLLGGPKFTLRSSKSRVEPYAHALAGAALFNSTGRFAIAVGGGVDVRVTDGISIRAIQADYAPVFSSGDVLHNVRLATGVVFRF